MGVEVMPLPLPLTSCGNQENWPQELALPPHQLWHSGERFRTSPWQRNGAGPDDEGISEPQIYFICEQWGPVKGPVLLSKAAGSPQGNNRKTGRSPSEDPMVSRKPEILKQTNDSLQ